MRTFTSARGMRAADTKWRTRRASSESIDQERVCHRRLVEAEPSITPEDGDLWQPIPKTDTNRLVVPLPVFMDITASAESQADARWAVFLTECGFEPLHDRLPDGFEEFDWTPVFPLDREEVARLLEPVVSQGRDIQAAIERLGRSPP